MAAQIQNGAAERLQPCPKWPRRKKKRGAAAPPALSAVGRRDLSDGRTWPLPNQKGTAEHLVNNWPARTKELGHMAAWIQKGPTQRNQHCPEWPRRTKRRGPQGPRPWLHFVSKRPLVLPVWIVPATVVNMAGALRPPVFSCLGHFWQGEGLLRGPLLNPSGHVRSPSGSRRTIVDEPRKEKWPQVLWPCS